MSKKTFTKFLLIFLTFFILIIYLNNKKLISLNKIIYYSYCKILGGNFINVTWGHEFCLISFSDGGKSCKNSSECKGDCQFNFETQNGNCANDNYYYGMCKIEKVNILPDGSVQCEAILE